MFDAPSIEIDIPEDAIDARVAAGMSTQVIEVNDVSYVFVGRGKLSGTWRYRRRTPAQEVTDDARPGADR